MYTCGALDWLFCFFLLLWLNIVIRSKLSKNNLKLFFLMKFYNPTTKKTVVSKRANFDERHFPLSKWPTEPSIPVPITPTHSLPLLNRPTPSLPEPRRPEAPYYIPPASDHTDFDYESTSETDDESSSDKSMDHGGVLGVQHPQLS